MTALWTSDALADVLGAEALPRGVGRATIRKQNLHAHARHRGAGGAEAGKGIRAVHDALIVSERDRPQSGKRSKDDEHYDSERDEGPGGDQFHDEQKV